MVALSRACIVFDEVLYWTGRNERVIGQLQGEGAIPGSLSTPALWLPRNLRDWLNLDGLRVQSGI